MKKYICTDENGDSAEIPAESPRAAAEKFAAPWKDGTETATFWVDVIVSDPDDEDDDGERYTVAIDPDEPECALGLDHDWQSPHGIVGGLRENPGVYGSGGGVAIAEVCSVCGRYRVTDTWAQNPSTGEQGLSSVEYRDADEESLAWCLLGIRDQVSDLSVDAMDVSHGIFEDARRICAQINGGKLSRDEAADCLEDLRERLAEAVAEADA